MASSRSSRFGQPKDRSTPPSWRPFAHPKVDAIEVSPVVILHNGMKNGGALYRSGLRWSGQPHTKSFSIKPTEETILKRVEIERDFLKIVENCEDTQRDTWKLFKQQKELGRRLGKGLDDVSSRLQIMRSMPDLTVSPEDFAEFVDDVLAQPKLRPEPGSIRMTGSVQHIFPLRDWNKGGRVKLGKKKH